ncbi:fumarylacetoacetase [Rubrivirga sp. S365]|uniref:fumarylacetoacetase n=1 Tax=Rubrivirga sp. S365 TaxID=3076080 RepID=UPI0028C73E16|nr:fumarylacetoacetase [Rubrivirga sp. S365]MDT7857857.1 fumarylacetoacetase [Rubrivirga sp. S365]
MNPFLDVPADSGFGLHNLPYGVFSHGDGGARVGVRLGDYVVDLAALETHGLVAAAGAGRAPVFSQPALNALMALGPDAWSAVRERLQDLLSDSGDPALREGGAVREAAVLPLADVTMHLPARIGDYTDFYSSRQHATNVGTMFRGPENALKPNWLHLPVGYHGRASSVVVSGTDVVRPSGQTRPDDDAPPTFGPSKRLDIELELGFFVGPGNELGDPISISDADRHIFGFVLVNDWSARDIQKWEYVPLGPFLGKSFATSVSPWVVPYEALAPFRVDGEPQDATAGNPEPLPYLRQRGPRALDVDLEVRLQTSSMDEGGEVVAQTTARNLYWSPEQQLAHHTVNGCNARPGDLMASGTISGEDPGSYGSLLEMTWSGKNPLSLPGGETRTFLEDGDRVTITGEARRDGVAVGFGEVTGRVLPPRP